MQGSTDLVGEQVRDSREALPSSSEALQCKNGCRKNQSGIGREVDLKHSTKRGIDVMDQIFMLSNLCEELDLNSIFESNVVGVFQIGKASYLIERDQKLTILAASEDGWSEHSFAWNSSSSICAISSESTESFVLAITCASQLFVIPSSGKPCSPHWRPSEITHFGIQNDLVNPSSACWWELKNGANVAVVSDRSGRVIFIDLSSGLTVGRLEVPLGVERLDLLHLADHIALIITDLNNEQSMVVLETSHYTYPLDAVVVPSFDSAVADHCGPRSRLKSLKNFSSEALASLKQKIVDKTKGAFHGSSLEENYNPQPTKLQWATPLKPCCVDREHIWLEYNADTGLTMIHRNPCDFPIDPLYMFKLPPGFSAIVLTRHLLYCCDGSNTVCIVSNVLANSSSSVGEGYDEGSILARHSFPTDEKILKIMSCKDTVVVMGENKSNSLDLQTSRNPIFMRSNVPIDDVQLTGDSSVDSCLIWTEKGLYLWKLRHPIKKLIVSVATALNPMEAVSFSDEITRLLKVFCVSPPAQSEVFLAAADIRLSRREFPQAIALYRRSRCAHLQTALRFSAAGHTQELLGFLQVLWSSKGVVTPHPDRIQLGNLAAIAYAKQLGAWRNQSLWKQCMSFLHYHVYYDAAVAVKAFAKSGLWSLVHFVTLRRGVQSDLLNLLMTVSDSQVLISGEEKYLFLCLTEPTLQSTVLVNYLCEEYFALVEPFLPRFPNEVLQRLVSVFDPVSPVGVGNYDQLLQFYQRIVTSLPENLVIPTCDGIPAFSVNSVLCCGYGSVVATRDDVLFTWGMGPCGTMDQPPSFGGVETREPFDVRFFQELKLTIRSVACGKEHVVVVTDRGVFTWGNSKYGQLGLGDVRTQKEARRLDFEEEVIKVAAGMYHSLLLTSDGRVYSYGWGAHGQLGHGNSESYRHPRLIKSITSASDIVTGYCHSAVLTQLGEVWIFGGAYYGQTGIGDTHKITVPVKLDLPQISVISAGYFFTCAVTSEGSMLVCGATPLTLREQNLQQKRIRISNAKKNSGLFQQEMDNAAAPRRVIPSASIEDCNSSSNGSDQPQILPSLEEASDRLGRSSKQNVASTRKTGESQTAENSGVPSISVSYADALKSSVQPADGQIMVKLPDLKDQIVVGLKAKEGVPEEKSYLWPKEMDLSALRDQCLTKIACASNQILILTNTGSLYSWRPKLGLCQVRFEEDNSVAIVDISAGWDFNVARDSNGELWSWGNNTNGQLGFPSITENRKDGVKSVQLKNGKRILGKLPLAGNVFPVPKKIIFPEEC